MHKEFRARRYLGDGVYASFDGYQIVLWADPSAYGPGYICLDHDVLEALDKYRTALNNITSQEFDVLPETI